MRLTVYAGSSLPRDEVPGLRELAADRGVELVIRPPIIRGDLLRLRPDDGWAERALILDGEFGQSLSVSVTEIREYLARGAYLSGAASMGALRAVECRTLGMISHGWVAEQYLRGRIDSDADVALLMDPLSYQAQTVPLVNVRWLLGTLPLEGPQAGRALRAAGMIHYRERTPPTLRDVWRRELPAYGVLADVLADHLESPAGWDRKAMDGVLAVRAELEAMGR